MASTWAANVVGRVTSALLPLRDPARSVAMAAHMKDVAPFLGVTAPARRAALRPVWRELEAPTSDELGEAALTLMAQQEREFHYASYDVVDRFRPATDEAFLDVYVTELLTAKPWWDTVDGFVNAAVSPLCLRYDADWLVDDWSDSADRWLIRAAIGHQRGWKERTDVPRVLELCDQHWADREFFIAKAIGWALRDLTRIDPRAVETFLDRHPTPNRVAAREAERGLAAQARSGGKRPG